MKVDWQMGHWMGMLSLACFPSFLFGLYRGREVGVVEEAEDVEGGGGATRGDGGGRGEGKGDGEVIWCPLLTTTWI